MSIFGSVQITGFIAPTYSGDTYATHDAYYGRDGLRNVDVESDLDSITALRRKAGMIVGVSGGTQHYRLLPEPWTFTFSDWALAFLTPSQAANAFTGNTSASCITDLYVHNLYGCSPISLHDDMIIDQNKVFGTNLLPAALYLDDGFGGTALSSDGLQLDSAWTWNSNTYYPTYYPTTLIKNSTELGARDEGVSGRAQVSLYTTLGSIDNWNPKDRVMVQSRRSILLTKWDWNLDQAQGGLSYSEGGNNGDGIWEITTTEPYQKGLNVVNDMAYYVDGGSNTSIDAAAGKVLVTKDWVNFNFSAGTGGFSGKYATTSGFTSYVTQTITHPFDEDITIQFRDLTTNAKITLDVTNYQVGSVDVTSTTDLTSVRIIITG